MKSFLISAFICLASTAAFTQGGNLKTIVNNYTAFQNGDYPAIAETFAKECNFSHSGDQTIVPFAGSWKGQDAVIPFLDLFTSAMVITVFEPSNFRQEGDRVVTSVHLEGRGPNTDIEFRSDFEYVWSFDEEGNVTQLEIVGPMEAIETALKH